MKREAAAIQSSLLLIWRKEMQYVLLLLGTDWRI